MLIRKYRYSYAVWPASRPRSYLLVLNSIIFTFYKSITVLMLFFLLHI